MSFFKGTRLEPYIGVASAMLIIAALWSGGSASASVTDKEGDVQGKRAATKKVAKRKSVKTPSAIDQRHPIKRSVSRPAVPRSVPAAEVRLKDFFTPRIISLIVGTVWMALLLRRWGMRVKRRRRQRNKVS